MFGRSQLIRRLVALGFGQPRDFFRCNAAHAKRNPPLADAWNSYDSDAADLEQSCEGGRRLHVESVRGDVQIAPVVRDQDCALLDQPQRKVRFARTAFSEQQHSGLGGSAQRLARASEHDTARVYVDDA